jgi:hemerythrin-like metal-binding protein
MTAQAFIIWNDEYSVGLEEIDEHHKTMFSIINRLYTAIMENAPQDTIKELIQEARRYSGYHFSMEEAKLKEAGYRELTEHRKAHQHYITELDCILDQYGITDQLKGQDMLIFLKKWWSTHILKIDKAYSAHLQH